MSDTEQGDDYKVGYGKPPRRTRFQKGQSGNPRGSRPPQTLPEAAAALLKRRVPLTLNGKRQSATMREALLMAQIQKGITGNTRAAKLVLDLSLHAPPEMVDTTREGEQDCLEAIAGMTVDELGMLNAFHARLAEISSRRKKK